MSAPRNEWADLVAAESRPLSLIVHRTRWLRRAGTALVLLGLLGVAFSPTQGNVLFLGPLTVLAGMVIGLIGFMPTSRLRSRMQQRFPELGAYPRPWNLSSPGNYVRWTRSRGLSSDVMRGRR